MKTLFKVMAIVAVFWVVGLPSISMAAPTLKDFGYANMSTKRTIHIAVILVNFTNTPVGDNIASPYVMGSTPVGTNFAAAEQYYTNWISAVNGNTNPTVNGYLFEASLGRTHCEVAGLTMLTLDTNLNYAGVAARVGGPGPTADREYAANFLWLAASRANFAVVTNRDVDHNGWITDSECTLVLLSNDRTVGGGHRDPGLLPLPNTTKMWNTDFTFQRVDDTPLNVTIHELIHVLQDGHSGDIYGPDQNLSEGFTIMSRGIDPQRAITHPDAFHKLQLAWSEPRIHSMREPGLLTLPAAQLMRSNAPVILYDPLDANRNTREFFILEYRTRTTDSAEGGYDWQVGGGNGLVIWHVRQNSEKDPVEYTQTMYPEAERHWRQCIHCQALFSTASGNMVCASTNEVHEAKDSHICLPHDDPSVEGVRGWYQCTKCSQLLYLTNLAATVCAAGSHHINGSYEYRLRADSDPEALGTRGWWMCGKCQCLVRDGGVCSAGGAHVRAAATPTYTLFWWQDLQTIMNAGSPNLSRGRGNAWGSGSVTPLLRYYDGVEARTRLAVHPFAEGADEITVEVQPNYDAWVDFSYIGVEDGSFERPFNTFAEGVSEVYAGGVLRIKAGSSAETQRVSKPMRIESSGGVVHIGQ